MDIADLASSAVSVVANHLSAVGAGVVDAAQQGTAAMVYSLLRDRLSRTELGKTVLEQLGKQPQDPERQRVAAAVVAEQADADPEFARMLQWSVSSVVHQGVSGQVTRHQPMNVTAGRDMRVDRSYIAAGDIDNRRTHVRIGTGGWLVLVVVLLAIAATTTGVLIGSSDDVDPAEIGTDVGEAGVRQTAEAVRDAYADRDADLLCTLSSAETQEISEYGTEAHKPPSECPRILGELTERIPDAVFTESRTFAVEDIEIGTDDLDVYDSDEGTDEKIANVMFVNRTPDAQCQNWVLSLVREHGRWVLNLLDFKQAYLDEDDVGTAENCHSSKRTVVYPNPPTR